MKGREKTDLKFEIGQILTFSLGRNLFIIKLYPRDIRKVFRKVGIIIVYMQSAVDLK